MVKMHIEYHQGYYYVMQGNSTVAIFESHRDAMYYLMRNFNE